MTHPSLLAVLGMPGGWEVILILVVVLVLFGNRIPGVARSLGSGITEFKKGLHEGDGKSRGGDKGSGGDDPGSKDDAQGADASR